MFVNLGVRSVKHFSNITRRRQRPLGLNLLVKSTLILSRLSAQQEDMRVGYVIARSGFHCLRLIAKNVEERIEKHRGGNRNQKKRDNKSFMHKSRKKCSAKQECKWKKRLEKTLMPIIIAKHIVIRRLMPRSKVLKDLRRQKNRLTKQPRIPLNSIYAVYRKLYRLIEFRCRRLKSRHISFTNSSILPWKCYSPA